MADKAQQDLAEHIKQTANGLYDDDSESDPFKSEASYIGRSVKEQHVKVDVIDNIFRTLVLENMPRHLDHKLFIQLG